MSARGTLAVVIGPRHHFQRLEYAAATVSVRRLKEPMSTSPVPSTNEPRTAPSPERIGRNGLPLKPEAVVATATSSTPWVWWVVAVVGMIAFLWPSTEKVSNANLGVLHAVRDGSTPCVGKTRCLVAVVAPWCGACRRSKGFIQHLKQRIDRDPTSSMQIVVSGDQPAALRAYADEYAAEAALVDDEQGTFARSVDISAFPTFVVLNEHGAVVSRTSGAPMHADDAETTAWLTSALQWSETADRR